MKLAHPVAYGLLYLGLGGIAGSVSAPAAAQQATVPSLNAQERAALFALTNALQNRDYGAAAGALTSARSAASSGYARYAVAALQFRLGLETNNLELQSSAIDAMLASGMVPAADLPALYQNQGALALSAGKYDRAEAAFTRWAEVAPASAEALIALSEVKAARKRPEEAIALLGRAVAIRSAAGQKAPESWYLRGIKQAFDARMVAPAMALSQELVRLYPSPENWRDALLSYQELQPADPALTIDAMRLMRETGALAGERDYLKLAAALSEAGYPTEAKAVLDKGVAARMVDPAKDVARDMLAGLAKRLPGDRRSIAALEGRVAGDATGAAARAAADAHLSQGNHAKAAELYAAALAKGGVDTALVQTRLGMALGLAGRRAEAETALRSVTGPRAGLAQYWLTWLGQGRPSA